MLKVATDLDILINTGLSQSLAVETMHQRGSYNRVALWALNDYQSRPVSGDFRDVFIRDLEAGMVVDEDVLTRNGLLLLATGQEVTEPVIARLAGYRDTQGVIEPFRIRCTASI